MDRFDSLGSVHVSSSPQFDSLGWPSGPDLGFCQPTSPFGEPDKFTCKPSTYKPGYTSRLPPGTYYWWLSFWRSNPAEGSGSLGSASFGPVPVHRSCAHGAGYWFRGPCFTGRWWHRSVDGKLSVRVPSGSSMRIYASDSSEKLSDGSPLGLE